MQLRTRLFLTVTGGYLVGQLDVYGNGVKLVDTQDYTADGASVTFARTQ